MFFLPWKQPALYKYVLLTSLLTGPHRDLASPARTGCNGERQRSMKYGRCLWSHWALLLFLSCIALKVVMRSKRRISLCYSTIGLG